MQVTYGKINTYQTLKNIIKHFNIKAENNNNNNKTVFHYIIYILDIISL